jgi:hypothetical protein
MRIMQRARVHDDVDGIPPDLPYQRYSKVVLQLGATNARPLMVLYNLLADLELVGEGKDCLIHSRQ